jgi:acyl-coenzyme A thioesterase 13
VGDVVPEGFTRSERTGPFFDLIGPIHTKDDDRGTVLGLRARMQHCNARGFVHAAVLTALLDVVCGRNCTARLPPGTNAVTVNLNLDFVSIAHDGDWLEASATVTRAGTRVAFADARVEVNGAAVAKASAVFVVGSKSTQPSP